MIYFLSKNYKNISNAGNKAKTDIEEIMSKLNYSSAGLVQTSYNNGILSFILTFIGVVKTFFTLSKGDIIVLQYPLKKYYKIVCNMAHIKGAKVVTQIHDLGCFRRKILTEEEEIVILNHSDVVISHNRHMSKWLKIHGSKSELLELEIFDYLSLTSASSNVKENKYYEVLYAGALKPKKNAFLYELANAKRDYCLNLYGNGFDSSLVLDNKLYNYMGFVPSDKLIANAKGDFGLVWDGTSLAACEGDFGTYLQYNNPHKTSLYIKCELPVIIWDKAALADFVRENNIGICISSLEDLNEVLKNLSPKDYREMKANVQIIAKRLSEGYYFSKVITKAIVSLF